MNDALSVLLVEDNDDFRFYLKDNLRNKYKVIEAVNGKDVLAKSTVSSSSPDRKRYQHAGNGWDRTDQKN